MQDYNITHSNVDQFHYNKTYQSGFTFWLGGTSNWLRQIASHGSTGATAMMQCHTGSDIIIYFQCSTSGSFNGWLEKAGFGGQTNFPSFAMTTGHNDIHVLRFEFMIASNGTSNFKIWYNGTQRANINQSTSWFGGTPFQDLGFTYRNPFPINSSTGQEPSVVGGSSFEPTVYVDRLWRKRV